MAIVEGHAGEAAKPAFPIDLDSIRYVDEKGVAFAALSPAVGNPDLPLVTGAKGGELQRCEDLLQTFTRTARTLGPKLGVLLFQLPPTFNKNIEVLSAFLELLRGEEPSLEQQLADPLARHATAYTRRSP